jgi:hypothetical protein
LHLAINPQLIYQLVELGGLDLSLDRTVTLLPGLQEILEADAPITPLDLGILTIVGLPWSSETRPVANALALGIGAACESSVAVSHRIPPLTLPTNQL